MTDAISLLSPHAPSDLVKAEACLQNGDLAGFRALMAGGASSLSDLKGVTALHLAVAHGSSVGVRHALLNKADPDAVDLNGETPLMWACKTPAPVALGLIDQFKGIGGTRTTTMNRASQANHQGQTALHLAALHGQTLTCEKLIDELFVDPTAQDQEGNTVLHLLLSGPHAGRNGLTPLLVRGVNPRTTNRQGDTPLALAQRQGFAERAVELEQTVDLQGALTSVMTGNDMPMSVRQRRLQALVRQGVDVNRTLGNEKPLTTAVMRDWGLLVWVLLVEARADPNGCVNQDQRDHPLYRAVSNLKVSNQLIEVLIAAGADVNVQATGQHRQTPLHLAVADGALGKVETLLGMGANPLLRDERGLTPLDLAPPSSPIAQALAAAQVEVERTTLHQTVERTIPPPSDRRRTRL